MELRRRNDLLVSMFTSVFLSRGLSGKGDDQQQHHPEHDHVVISHVVMFQRILNTAIIGPVNIGVNPYFNYGSVRCSAFFLHVLFPAKDGRTRAGKTGPSWQTLS